MFAKKIITIATTAIALMLAGCSAPKKVPYLVDAENLPQNILDQVNSIQEPVIVPGDLLNIRVYASNPAAVAQFNKSQYIDEDGRIMQMSSNMSGAQNNYDINTDYYLVNTDGDIDFPVLGIIHVSGKTKQQIAEQIQGEIYPKYIKLIPTVEIRLMNFKVTVLGQVKNPGVYTSNNERMNILEALAKAGDLDIKGDRENIMLIRTGPDGKRQVHRLNIHDRDLLLSPLFNLQQNDFIYVVPNRSAASSAWQMHQGWTSTITVISGVSSLASLVIGVINLTKN